MYSEWTSVENEVRDLGKCTSVLLTYPPNVGRDVAKCIVPSLLGGVTNGAGSKTPEGGSTPRFRSDADLKWSMEVVCFGLSLMEYETLRDSVNVYIDWLSVLTIPKPSVPDAVKNEPLPYVRIMLNHLQNLFIPRNDGNAATQANLCQSVLKTVQYITQNSISLDRETWETMLMFILNVCDRLLSSPAQINGLAEILCEELMQTLIQIWLVSSTCYFPSPPFWKTARQFFAEWRHHPPVVEYWCKITSALTAKVVSIMHGPSYPKMRIPDDDLKMIPSNMTNEVVMQTWFRMLHLINNPADLANATIISKNPRFFDAALTRDSVQDPSQHLCLSVLPGIFLRAMRGISDHVDGFLGITSPKKPDVVYSNLLARIANPDTPPISRKGQKNTSRKQPSGNTQLGKNTATVISTQKSNTSPSTVIPQSHVSSSMDMQPKPAKDRPQVNSVLHLYGQWLFKAAVTDAKPGQVTRERGGSLIRRGRSSSTVFNQATISTSSLQSQESVSIPSMTVTDGPDPTDSFDAGRSEASGTLCRIFSCKRTGEQILPIYLSRFYLTVGHGLLGDSYQVLASILVNSVNLFRTDLPGVTCLLPAMLSALETILPDKELGQFKPYVNVTELRRASIHLLLSMIPLALHYDDLPIKDIQSLWVDPQGEDSDESGGGAKYTFRSLKLRIIQQLIGALQCEADSTNTQMILGGMLLALQDFALFESAENDEVTNAAKRSSDNVCIASDLPVAHRGDVIVILFAHGCSELLTHMVNYLGHDARMGQTPRTFLVNSTSLGYAEFGNPKIISFCDTAYGFFVSCIHLVSQKLEASKSELSVSLAALELLAGLAKAKISITDSGECRRAVSELCRYIVSQCERPPPHHKRELHSMIVAAFHTLTTWLLEHPYLLDDKKCLSEVLEIIELGISGSKSSPDRRGSGVGAQLSGNNKVVLKGDKEINPASRRVLEAAEGTLLCVFEHLGSFPSPLSPGSTCSLLNEVSLVMHAAGYSSTEEWRSSCDGISFQDAVKRFKYFVIRNTVLLGILEQNIGNNEEPTPAVTLVIRSAGGRKAYSMEFRQTSRSDKQSTSSYLARPPRPKPDPNPGVHHNVRHQTFPPEVDRIPLVKADCSIPLLSEIPEEEQTEKLRKIQALIDQQKQYDLKVERRLQTALEDADDPLSLKMQEAVPPESAKEFQTARLLLSHLNILTLDSVKQGPHQRLDLVMLNRLDQGFSADLEDLDSIPVRNNDTVFVFYHKAGQTTKEQILENTSVKCSQLRPEFSEFLASLGWPVDLKTHPGWTGHTSTSWKLNHTPSSSKVIDMDSECPGVFNGEKYILYHADALTEVAFIIPTRHPNPPLDGSIESDGDAMDEEAREKLQLDLSSVHSTGSMNSNESPNSPTGSIGPLSGPRAKKMSSASRSNLQQLPDCRVAVIWTESYDEIDSFPLEDLLSEMHTGQEIFTTAINRKGILAIFIHPMENGLFSITVHGRAKAKSGMAIPLVSGSIVSRRALGPAVRMTASNMCHRRRLDSDSYLPPHIKRKYRINDLLLRYQKRCTEPDFFTAVFAEQYVTKPMLPGRMLGMQPQGNLS